MSDTKASTIAKIRAEVEAVFVRYATGIDTKDWDLFATCFSLNCVATHNDVTFEGRDTFVQAMRIRHEELAWSLHRITNVRIEEHGPDQCRARAYADAMLAPLADKASPIIRATGYYHDTFELLEGTWLVARRNFVPLWGNGVGHISSEGRITLLDA